ncbi:MAG: TIGR03936 family radical SAM-associated protein [Acidimicrobiales bacterium]
MRVRIRFTKAGKVRFLSHRDLARIWERAMRRAELPVTYSVGFSPRPKLHFGLALSVGHESMAEYLDVDLVSALTDADFALLPARLSEVMPEGIDCTAAAEPPAGESRSLQEAVSSVTWSFLLEGGDADAARSAAGALLASPCVMVERDRKSKTHHDDIRPYVLDLRLVQDETEAEHHPRLLAELATQPRGLRPGELIAALGTNWQELRVCRLAQWIDQPDGSRVEPLALPAVGVAAAAGVGAR